MNRQRNEFLKSRKDLASWGFLLLSALAPAQAETVSAQDQVKAAIQIYVNDLHGDRFTRVESDIQPLDSRLQLKTCDAPLEIEHRPKERMAGRVTFKTHCTGTQAWTIHVPASIKTFAKVVVAASGIPMGTQISARDLAYAEQDVSLLHRGYFHSADDISGFVAKRPIPAGQVLTPVTVDPAKLVNKGENVAIVAEGSGITIRASGVAMTDGTLGELIQVRNTKSNKVVEGRIIAPGQIKVSL